MAKAQSYQLGYIVQMAEQILQQPTFDNEIPPGSAPNQEHFGLPSKWIRVVYTALVYVTSKSKDSQ